MQLVIILILLMDSLIGRRRSIMERNGLNAKKVSFYRVI